MTRSVALALMMLACIFCSWPSVAESKAAPIVRVNLKVVDKEGDRVTPGMKVYVGYDQVGVTDRNHRAILRLRQGSHRIVVLDPRRRAGLEEVVVRGRKTRNITVTLASEMNQAVFPRKLRLDQGPILRPDVDVLSGAFYDNRGRRVQLQTVMMSVGNKDEQVDLGSSIDLLPDGRFRTRPGTDLAKVARLDGTLRVAVEGKATDGTYVEDQINVAVGRFRLKGHLIASPSQPDLNVALVTLTGVFMSSNPDLKTIFSIRTSVDGSFDLRGIPFGLVYFEYKGFSNNSGIFYYGGWLVTESDSIAVVRMLTAGELSSGLKGTQLLNANVGRRRSN